MPISLRLFAAALFVAASLPCASPARADDLESLAARVQQLEDREEIRELILAYGRALDSRDFVAFSELFARDDGEWVGGFGSARGRDEIFELMDSTIGHDPEPRGHGSFHVLTNERIDVAGDGDTATAVTKWIFVMRGDDGNPRWVYLGHYDDRFIREDGQWRFLRREAFTDLPAPEDDGG